MTAEVAILNKSAVALAADSAVSIGAPPNLKIYNTVNKIFELNVNRPIGIMIYGRLDFMGLPLETIIKQYRKQIGQKPFKTIREAGEDFRRYLSTDVPFSVSDDESNMYLLIYSTFSKINKAIDELILEDMQARGSFKKSKINAIAQKYISEKIKGLRARQFAAGFTKKSIPDLYKPAVEDMIDECFRLNLPNEGTKTKIRDLAGYCISKRTLSDYRTGVVIAGFGDEELCPSLYQFEMDGMIDGKLKLYERQYIDIGRGGSEADILGFAQDDMMKSFLNGVDPQIQRYFSELHTGIINDAAKVILSAVLNDPAREAAALAGVQGTLTALSNDVAKKAEEYIERNSAKPIRDMIRSMPKQELATLASSLIEITSLKRKVTRVQETVGGEVDVAIISKSEGFVWTKRKHYFPAELNRRFFVRHFGNS